MLLTACYSTNWMLYSLVRSNKASGGGEIYLGVFRLKSRWLIYFFGVKIKNSGVEIHGDVQLKFQRLIYI